MTKKVSVVVEKGENRICSTDPNLKNATNLHRSSSPMTIIKLMMKIIIILRVMMSIQATLMIRESRCDGSHMLHKKDLMTNMRMKVGPKKSLEIREPSSRQIG